MSEPTTGVTAPQPRKWCEEICAWAKGCQIEHTWRDSVSGPWSICVGEPRWDDPDFVFRIHDPYRHLRDAIRAGEKIEFCDPYSWGIVWASIGTEFDHNPNRTFALPPDRYRIATKAPLQDKDRINFTHFLQGGTFVTNFSEVVRPVYVEAVRRFGDATLFVADKPSHHMHGPGGSLHMLKRHYDLSDFWRVFDQVKKDLEPKKAPKPDYVRKGVIYWMKSDILSSYDTWQVSVTLSGETDKPISVEVCK